MRAVSQKLWPLKLNARPRRVVDYPPGMITPLHRTVSLDYAVVLKGSIVMHLDDGSTTRVHEGEVIVQRGTMHAWENPSSTDWARILFHLAAVQGPIVLSDGASGLAPNVTGLTNASRRRSWRRSSLRLPGLPTAICSARTVTFEDSRPCCTNIFSARNTAPSLVSELNI